MDWSKIVVRCVNCRNPTLCVLDNSAAVRCASCGSLFAVYDGIPIVLPQKIVSAEFAISAISEHAHQSHDIDLATRVAVANKKVYDDLGFDGYARIHHTDGTHQSRIDYEKLFQAVKRHSPEAERVVDMGAGDCRLALLAKQHFPEVVAIDISPNMLPQSRADRAGVVLVCAVADNTPLADKSVDVVFAAALLHHLVDIAGFFREVYRILRPGGVLSTTHDPLAALTLAATLARAIPRGRSKKRWFAGELGALSEYQVSFGGLFPRSLRRQLSAAGFQSIKIETYVTPASFACRWLNYAVLAIRMAHRVCPSLFSTHLQITAVRPP